MFRYYNVCTLVRVCIAILKPLYFYNQNDLNSLMFQQSFTITRKIDKKKNDVPNLFITCVNFEKT